MSCQTDYSTLLAVNKKMCQHLITDKMFLTKRKAFVRKQKWAPLFFAPGIIWESDVSPSHNQKMENASCTSLKRTNIWEFRHFSLLSQQRLVQCETYNHQVTDTGSGTVRVRLWSEGSAKPLQKCYGCSVRRVALCGLMLEMVMFPQLHSHSFGLRWAGAPEM